MKEEGLNNYIPTEYKFKYEINFKAKTAVGKQNQIEVFNQMLISVLLRVNMGFRQLKVIINAEATISNIQNLLNQQEPITNEEMIRRRLKAKKLLRDVWDKEY